MADTLDIPLSLNAGIDLTLPMDQGRVYLKEATGDVLFKGKGVNVTCSKGQGFVNRERLERVRLRSETTQNIVLTISDSEFIDKSITGNVSVGNTVGIIEASKTQSAQMRTFAGGMEAVAPNGEIFYTGIWNSEGEDIYLTRFDVGIAFIDNASKFAQFTLIKATLPAAPGAGWTTVTDTIVDKDTGAAFATRLTSIVANPGFGDFTASDAFAGQYIGEQSQLRFFSEQSPLKLAANECLIIQIFNQPGTVYGGVTVEGQTAVPQSFSGAAAQNADGLDFIELGQPQTQIANGILEGQTLTTIKSELGISELSTSALIADPTSSINTRKKYMNKQVYLTDTGAVVVASGSSPQAAWV